jgi:phosphate transport system ATP-binding protein
MMETAEVRQNDNFLDAFGWTIVTHNLQQAQRVADKTGFLYVDTSEGGRTGYLVEFGDSRQIFQNPQEKHTKEHISGKFS